MSAKGQFGPSQGTSVEPHSGIQTYRPASDITAYSPNFGSVVFKRSWSNRLTIDQYGSPGLPVGWVHNWDLIVIPTGEAETWHDLDIVYPNGLAETWSVELDGGDPTGKLIPPVGSEYLVNGTPSETTGDWDSLAVTFKDQTTWTFTPHPTGVYAIHQVANRMGSAIEFAFDDWGRLQTITDVIADTVVLELGFDGDGWLDNVADPVSGRLVFYTMADYEGELKALEEVSQVVPVDEDEPPMRWRYDYLRVEALGGGYDEYHYGYWGPDYSEDVHDHILLLSGITVPSPTGTGESTASLRYYAQSYMAAGIIDGNGNQTWYFYDAETNVMIEQVLDPDGNRVQTTEITTNADGMVTSSSCGSCPTTIEYNDSNNPFKPTLIVAPDLKETSLTYDDFGNPLTVTDPRGNVLTNTWDYDDFELGRLVTVERTSDSVTKTLAEYTRDTETGLVLTVSRPKPGTTDGSTVTWTYTHDALGNPLTIEAPGNDTAATITTTLDYGGTPRLGQPLTVTDNLDHVTTNTFDGRGNRTAVEDALGHVWDRLYNLADQLVESWQPATGQQGSGRVRVVNGYLYPSGPRTDVTVYDESDAVVQHINYHLGLEGELLGVTGGADEAIYEYDPLYRQVALTDGNGNASLFGYDAKSRLALIRYPLAEADEGFDTLRFTLYDDAGRPLTRVDGNDVPTEYTYGEPGGALTLIHYPDDDTFDVSVDHDSLGRPTSMTNNEGSVAWTFDDLDNPLTITTTYTGLDPKTITLTYNDDNSRHTMTTPGGTRTYGYDAAQRMVSLDYALGTAAWEWLDNNWLSRQTLPNGAYSDYDYLATGALSGLANKAPDDSEISTYGSFLYRGTGDLTTVSSTIPGATSLEGDVGYGYDTKRELTDEESDRNGGYDYANVFDAAGNPTTFRNDDDKAYNSDNQLTGPGTYVYDGNGNPTTWDSTTLTWDFENRLTAYGALLTAGYRGDSLRAWKEADSVRTYFLYDGINIVCELDENGDVVAESVFGAAGLLGRGDVQYQFDPLGDAVHLLDGDGDVTANRLFDAWGNELTSGTDPRGYRAQVGYYTDVETGLVALAYRYYAPGVGRFVNRDPALWRGGVNLCAYAASGPVAHSDVSGLGFGEHALLFLICFGAGFVTAEVVAVLCDAIHIGIAIGSAAANACPVPTPPPDPSKPCGGSTKPGVQPPGHTDGGYNEFHCPCDSEKYYKYYYPGGGDYGKSIYCSDCRKSCESTCRAGDTSCLDTCRRRANDCYSQSENVGIWGF